MLWNQNKYKIILKPKMSVISTVQTGGFNILSFWIGPRQNRIIHLLLKSVTHLFTSLVAKGRRSTVQAQNGTLLRDGLSIILRVATRFLNVWYFCRAACASRTASAMPNTTAWAHALTDIFAIEASGQKERINPFFD